MSLLLLLMQDMSRHRKRSNSRKRSLRRTDHSGGLPHLPSILNTHDNGKTFHWHACIHMRTHCTAAEIFPVLVKWFRASRESVDVSISPWCNWLLLLLIQQLWSAITTALALLPGVSFCPLLPRGTWRTTLCRSIKTPQRIKGDMGHLFPQMSHQILSLWGLPRPCWWLAVVPAFTFIARYLCKCTWLMAEKLWSDPALGHSNVTAAGQPWEWLYWHGDSWHPVQEPMDQGELWSTAWVCWQVPGRTSPMFWRWTWGFEVSIWREEQMNTLKCSTSINLQILKF